MGRLGCETHQVLAEVEAVTEIRSVGLNCDAGHCPREMGCRELAFEGVNNKMARLRRAKKVEV